MSEKKLRVNDLAKISGMTRNAIRFYEEKKLLHSERNAAGHREYSYGMIVRMAAIKKYQSVCFSLQDVAEQFTCSDLNSIDEALKDKERELDELALRYEQMAQKIREMRKRMENIPGLLGKYEITTAPEMLRVTEALLERIPVSKQAWQCVNCWLAAVPDVVISPLFFGDYWKNGEGKSHEWGLSIRAEKAEEKGLVQEEGVACLPSCRSLHTIVICDRNSEDFSGVLGPVMDYKKENKLELTGDIRFEQVVVTFEEKKKGYLELWIPVA